MPVSGPRATSATAFGCCGREGVTDARSDLTLRRTYATPRNQTPHLTRRARLLARRPLLYLRFSEVHATANEIETVCRPVAAIIKREILPVFYICVLYEYLPPRSHIVSFFAKYSRLLQTLCEFTLTQTWKLDIIKSINIGSRHFGERKTDQN